MQRAHRGELRLRDAVLGEPPAHRDLVRHQVRGLPADPGQAEILGDGRHDRDGPVGRDGEDAVDAVAAPDRGYRRGVGEVDDLADVGDPEPRCVRVAVDGDDANAELARALDRATLVPACADEQDGLHGPRLY